MSQPRELTVDEVREADFRTIRSMREQEKRKRELAKAVHDKLTPDELDALFRYPEG